MLVHKIDFRVAGVTFENEDGKDIQKEIKRILNEYKKNNYFDELYGGYINSEIIEMDLNVSEYEGYKFPAKLVGDEYNGEDCFKIYIKTYNDNYVHIGYAPKDNVNELAEWLSKEDLTIDGNLEITGGKYKYCEIYEEDYEEKEKVETKELKYGGVVTLTFCDNQISPDFINKQKEREIEKEKIKRGQDIANTAQIIFWIIFIGIAIFIFAKIWSFINWLFD